MDDRSELMGPGQVEMLGPLFFTCILKADFIPDFLVIKKYCSWFCEKGSYFFLFIISIMIIIIVLHTCCLCFEPFSMSLDDSGSPEVGGI